jgi:ABC-type Fe3+ transport system substrate-binding protein
MTRLLTFWTRSTLGLAAALVGTLAACAPAATPAAAPAPAAAKATTAQTAGTSTSPAGGSSDWDQLLAAAKREGKVVIVGPPGQIYRDGLVDFQTRFPDIALEYSGQSGRDFNPRVLTERTAGQYLWDVLVGGPESVNLELKPAGALDPIKPALVLPEVLDDTKWLGGFDAGFMDRENQYTYGFQGDLSQHVWVNREVIPESELSSVEQLTDPKWKGKISWNDPTAAGSGSAIAGYWLMLKGEDWVRTLFQQDVVATRDLRQQAEWIVRGRYPIAIGGDSTSLLGFQQQGIGAQVQTLAKESALGARLSPGFGNVMLINQAPHPNAAKVYLNWLLSREGQTKYATITERNSRRLDVQGLPDTMPRPGTEYVIINREENQPNIAKAMDLAKTILK